MKTNTYLKTYRPSILLGYHLSNPPVLSCSNECRKVGYKKIKTGYNNPQMSARMRLSQAIQSNRCVSAAVAAGNSNENTATV